MVTISVPTGPSVLLSGVKNEDIWFAFSAVYLISFCHSLIMLQVGEFLSE